MAIDLNPPGSTKRKGIYTQIVRPIFMLGQAHGIAQSTIPSQEAWEAAAKVDIRPVYAGTVQTAKALAQALGVGGFIAASSMDSASNGRWWANRLTEASQAFLGNNTSSPVPPISGSGSGPSTGGNTAPPAVLPGWGPLPAMVPSTGLPGSPPAGQNNAPPPTTGGGSGPWWLLLLLLLPKKRKR